MKRLLLAAFLLAPTAQADQADVWDDIGVIVNDNLSQQGEAIEICIEDDCQEWVYVSYETATEGEKKKQPKTSDKITDIVDRLLHLGKVNGTVKVSHKTSETKADGSSKKSETTVELKLGNGTEKQSEI